MAKSTFKAYSLYNKNLKTRNTLNISNLKGVDYRFSNQDISNSSYVDMMNIVYKDGVNQVRDGIDIELKIDEDVNGSYYYRGVYIVHIGNKLYWYENGVKTQCVGRNVADKKSFFIEFNNELIFLDGVEIKEISVVYISGSDGTEGKAVISSELLGSYSTIPVTTTNIVCDGAIVTNGIRTPLDDVNMASRYRTNKIITGVERNSSYTGKFRYVLDSRIMDSDVDIRWNTNSGIQYIVADSNNNLKIYASSSTIGSIYYGDSNTPAYIEFNNDLKNDFGSSTPNIIVKFKNYPSNDNYFSKLNGCTKAYVYDNRLFLTGNPDYPNVDWHSEENDSTYFSDLNYCTYGSTSTSVKGYATYSDGSLIVAKESGKSECTMYRRSSEWITATDYAGNKIDGSIEKAYPTFEINTTGGEGIGNNKAICNFMGDVVFVTKSGVKALKTTATVSTNEKISYDVSTYINPIIKNDDLLNARLYPNGKEMYLVTNNHTFIAYYDLRNEDGEYEWYPIDINPDDIILLTDGKLAFLKDNSIYKLDDGVFYDSYKYVFASGGLSYVRITNEDGSYKYRFVASYTYKDIISDGDIIRVKQGNNPIMAKIECEVVDNEKIRITNDTPLEYLAADGKTGKCLIWSGNNDSYRSFTLTDVTPNNEYKYRYFTIGNDLTGKDKVELGVYITDYNDYIVTNCEFDSNGAATFDLSLNGVVIDFFWDRSGTSFSGYILDKKPVNAYCITKAYDMNTISYDKTIYLLHLANDTNKVGLFEIGYIASRSQSGVYKMFRASGGKEIDYSDFNFNLVDFSNANLPQVFTKQKTIPNINSIRFMLKNKAGYNMVITDLNIIYTIGNLTRGVK